MRKEKEQEKIIIFEDDCLLVLNKPSGWIVNSSSTVGSQMVLQDWVEKNFKFQISRDKEFRSGIVHRLDKETSGVIVVAKTKEAFLDLQKQFKDRVVKKKYLALVHGLLKNESGEVVESVGRLPWNRVRFGVLPGGREAETRYRVRSKYQISNSKERFSLVELWPRTGRTHQIRIHMKYLGNPLVSDSFYAGRKTSRKDRLWCPRLFLHAEEINFVHPGTDKRVRFVAELPMDLKLALNKLQVTN